MNSEEGLNAELNIIKEKLLAEQGSRLKVVREALGLNQGQMASALSVAQSYWSYVERGKRDISKNMIDKLVYQFNASVQYIYLGIGEPLGNDAPVKKKPVIVDLALQDYYKELDRLYTCILSVIDLRIKHLGDDKEYSPYLTKLTHHVSRYADNVNSIELKKELFENYPSIKDAFIKDLLELFENYHFDASQSSTLVKRKFVAPKNVVQLN